MEMQMNRKNRNSNGQLWEFFLITFGFSWVCWLPGLLLTYGLLSPNTPISTAASILQWVGGIGPSVTALVLIYRETGKAGLKHLFSRAVKFNLGVWYLPTFLILPLVVILAHVLNGCLFEAPFPSTDILSEPWWIPALLAVFLILQLGEEPGWRGYALDRLQGKWGALSSSLLLGSIWAFWHIPMFLSSGFGQHDNQLPYGQFFITIVLVSILITWLQNNTGGSLVPAFVTHALFALTGEVLPLIEKNPVGPSDHTAWIITNILLFITVALVIAVWGRKRLAKENMIAIPI